MYFSTLLAMVNVSSGAYVAGNWAAIIIFCIATAWALLRLRKPGSSRLCISALLVLCVLLTGASLLALFLKVAELPEEVLLVPAILMIFSAGLGFLLAIGGLVTFDAKRHPGGGRGAAIGALVLACLYGAISLVATSVGVGKLITKNQLNQGEATAAATVVPGKLKVNRADLGFAVDIMDATWTAWDTITYSDSLPLLTEYAAWDDVSCVVVVTYEYPGAEELHLEAVAKAYLSDMNFQYARNDAEFLTRPLETPFPGLEIQTERELEGVRYKYIFRIYREGSRSWMVGGWQEQKGQGDWPGLVAKVDKVRVFSPSGRSRPQRKAVTELARKKLDGGAQFCNQAGLWYQGQEEYALAEKCYEQAAQLDPAYLTYRENVTYAREYGGNAQAALEYLQQNTTPKMKATQQYGLRESWLRIKTGQVEPGVDQIVKLIEEGYQNNGEVLAYINAVLDQEAPPQARRIADAYAAARPEPRTRLWQAIAAERAGEVDLSLEMLAKLAADEPTFPEARYELGETANEHGKYERALEVSDAMLKEGIDTTRLHLMRGWTYMGRKWYRDAKASFEKASALAPQDEDVQYALKEVSATLGQGSNSEIKQAVEAVPLPESIAKRLAEVREKEPEFGKGHPSAYLLWGTSYHYTPEDAMRVTHRRIIRIWNEEGADSFSTLYFKFDPLFERIYINNVVVRDAAGQEISRASVDDAYVLDDNGSMATGERILHIQVPGLKAGCAISAEVSVQRLGKRDSFPLQRNVFATTTPCQLEFFHVSGAVKETRHVVLNGEPLTVSQDEKDLVVSIAPSVWVPDEAFTRPASQWAPSLLIGSTKGNWEDLGREYLKDIADRLEPDPAVAEEARRLAGDLPDAYAKVSVLAAHVQKTVRYKAIEFGVRGRIPYPPGQTLSQRYGDCKDMALLLKQLLAAVDVPSQLVLVNSSSDLPLDPPDMDHFNHMILRVPGLPNEYVDLTHTYLFAPELAPAELLGRSVLVLDAEKPAIREIPARVREGSVLVRSKRVLSVPSPGLLEVAETLEFHGYRAEDIRNVYAFRDTDARFRNVQDLLDDYGDYRLESVEFQDFVELSATPVIKLRYLAPKALFQRDNQWKLRLPHPWERHHLEVPYMRERSAPFRMRTPTEFASSMEFSPEMKVAAPALQEFARRASTSYGSWELKEAGGGLEFRFAPKTGVFAPSEYPAFYSWRSGAVDAWNGELELGLPVEVTVAGP